MKKFLALLLALIMVLSLAACGPTPDPTEPPTNPTDPSKPTDPTNPTNPTDPTDPTDPPVADTYTYNLAWSTFPTTWNPHQYETATDSSALDYLVGGFYTFEFNETKDGYVLVPSMVVDEHPVDITADYVGQFGIEEGDTNQVYKMTLRDDLCWSNGDKITAHDYVESAKRLLNPAAMNYRADTLYAGSLVIHNAENYLKQGSTVNVPSDSVHEVYTEELDAQLIFSLAAPTGGNGEISMRTAFGFPASYDAAACAAYLINNYLGECAFTAETAATMEGMTLADIKADETLKAAWEAVIGWWQTEPNEELDFFLIENTYAETPWEEVGIFALSDTELVYVIDAPLSGFYLKYALPSTYLVHIPTYDACESITDGVYSNTYGTSAETTMSYGPYVMTSFQKDKEITYTKNETYFDLTEDTYQTTDINVQYVPEPTTRLEMFLQGKLDSYGLTKEDMDKYSLSDYTYYSVGDSTFAMTFNPGLEALQTAQETAGENINKTILTVIEFRMAMSLAMDRDNFCLATSPLNSAAFGLFSSNIISDPEAGVAYRTTDTAKLALAKFWGVSEDYGEGKMYADIDEAIDSITGYNLELAKQKFNEAYDIAIAEGLMDEDDVIQITVGIPNASSTFYKNGYEFIVNNYTEAVKGTKLQDKLTFNYDDTIGNDFSEALQTNQVNMLFGVGWTGSQLDPYGLMQVYVDPDYQYDSNFDLSAIDLTVVINGEELTTSVANWYYIMQGEAVTVKKADGTTVDYSCGPADNDPAARLEILGAMEQAILMNYNFIPLMDDAGATLKGMQINYYVEEYVPLMGFGGLKNYTYNYTDAEWDAFVQAQGGELDYT